MAQENTGTIYIQQLLNMVYPIGGANGAVRQVLQEGQGQQQDQGQQDQGQQEDQAQVGFMTMMSAMGQQQDQAQPGFVITPSAMVLWDYAHTWVLEHVQTHPHEVQPPHVPIPMSHRDRCILTLIVEEK